MRIAHVTSGLVRSAAGVRAVIMQLARSQAKAGHEVCVFGLDDPDLPSQRHDWDGLAFRAFPVYGPRLIGFAPGLENGLADFTPDIVHLHGLWQMPGHGVLKWHRRSQIPFLISPHGMLAEVALRYSPAKKRLARWMYQDAVFGATWGLHATSDIELAEIRNYGLTQPVAVIAHGVDVPPAEVLAGPAKRRTVLSLGRIHPKKGLDILIAAWAGVEADFPDWDLLIAGPDEKGHLAELRALTARLGLSRVRFQGPVFDEGKVALMAGSALFALPTRSENFAMTVVESLAAGTPVLSSKGAPWAALDAQRCGWWIDGTVDSFAAGLRGAMSLPMPELAAMGLRGRDWMERDFSWDAAATRMIAAYRWALGQGDKPDFVRAAA
jgi:glycosyltransferase involved in cell wall biosynthesis